MNDYVDLPVRDRMKAFVLSEDMADVHFSVGHDEFKERLPAHKFILSAASEVFHGMLYRRFDVPETINVDDTSPETFKLMLRHVYTDEVDLSPDNAFSLLYLATKYLLKNLVAQVLKYVATAYGDPSIVKVLPHLHLVDGENADCVWNVIGLYADIVLESPEFLELSHAVLCDLLRRDLNVDELTAYKSVVAWARAECQREELSFATDARAVLGDALKLIRFPSMSIEEFASGPADSNLLSHQEKLELYKWYGVRTGHVLTMFSPIPRKRPLLSCTRCDLSSLEGMWPNSPDRKWFFNFSVNAHIRCYGVGILGGESNTLKVTLSLLSTTSGENVAAKHTKVTKDANEDIYKVLFDRPVLIAPGTQYKITAVSVGPRSRRAMNGLREVTCDHGNRSATFTFTNTELRKRDEYDVSVVGHIPTIYFSFL